MLVFAVLLFSNEQTKREVIIVLCSMCGQVSADSCYSYYYARQ